MDSRQREASRPSNRAENLGAPRILVIGCGGAGSNTVHRLSEMGIEGAQTIAVNTDSQHLSTISADKRVLIGSRLTRGLGAGGSPELGRKAAESAKHTLADLVDGSDLVFVTAGLGGGTGTGVAPTVAAMAKSKGAMVVGMVTIPFQLERARRLAAEKGIEALRPVVDTLIVLDNEKLLECVPNLPLAHAFSVMDLLIAEIIKGITEAVTQPSIINLDYADVKTIMSSGGPSYMLVGEGKIRQSASEIVKSAMKNPLLDVDCRGAKGCLIHITGGQDMTLKHAAEIASALTQEIDPGANVIWGARVERGLEGKVRLIAIITGVKSSQVLSPMRERRPEPLKPKR